MKIITATEARKRFGTLLKQAAAEPVLIRKKGRDVAVVLSAEEYQRLTGVRPRIEELLQRSIQRHRTVYEALAKLD